MTDLTMIEHAESAHQQHQVTRRGVLAGLAALGSMTILNACGGRRLTANTPGPVWPDQRPPAPVQSNRPYVPPPVQQVYVPPPVVQQPIPTQPTGQVTILSRGMWTREQPRWNHSRPMNGVTRITVHHDALNASDLRGRQAAIDRLNNIRSSHLRRGPTWVDIGYHYIIDPEGRVWEGRPIGIEGAHVADTNDHNLGIMCMGNFEEHRPTQAQLNVLDQLLAQEMARHRVPMSRVYTHQELGRTECPGRNLQWYMKQTRAGGGRLAMLT